jgi:hypothetical protein
MSRNVNSRSLLNTIRPNECSVMKLIAQTWTVCEQSGRWTAALRTAFARPPEVEPQPRLYEVRTLEELSARLDEHECDLTLIEVGEGNLAEVLKLLVRHGRTPGRFAALLASSADHNGRQRMVDLLWEADVAEVVESPRQLQGLLALHNRLPVARGPINFSVDASQSFADWARSTLPWQDS